MNQYIKPFILMAALLALGGCKTAHHDHYNHVVYDDGYAAYDHYSHSYQVSHIPETRYRSYKNSNKYFVYRGAELTMNNGMRYYKVSSPYTHGYYYTSQSGYRYHPNHGGHYYYYQAVPSVSADVYMLDRFEPGAYDAAKVLRK